MKFTEFVKRYPNYSRFRFSTNAKGDVQFIFNGDEYTDMFDEKGRIARQTYDFPPYNGKTYKAENLNDFLFSDAKKKYEEQMEDEFGFPKKYRFNSSAYKITPWDKTPSKNNYTKFDVFITPSAKTQFIFRDIFTNTLLTFKSASEAKRWLDAPNLTYWSQALNFAVWCATGGCGVTRDMISDTQVGSFYRFHVIFTIRRVLNELQCPLPKDKHFSELNNFYNKAVYQKLKAEFKTMTSDFRFLAPNSHGLGHQYYWGYHGISIDDRDPYIPYHSRYQLSDEWDAAKNHNTHFEIAYIEDKRTEYQYEWFFPETSQGLTKAGLSRINQSVEAFVYCILGSQAQTRNSILGNSGGSEETKQVFLKLFESSVIENDISKSIQRYQFALQQAKQKLDLALALGCWLSPSYLLINNTSIAGYNNKLQKAARGMKLGLNNINQEIIPVVKHNMGHSKTNPPHKTHTEKKTEIQQHKISKPFVSQKHGNNLAVITISAAGLAWYMFR